MKLPVLSYTFLSAYRNCPRKAWHQYVAKDLPKWEKTPEQQVGIDVHDAFKLALQSKSLLQPVEPYRQHVETILASPTTRLIEYDLAIAKDGSRVGFWDERAWLRGKLDVTLLDAHGGAVILDWKTGKPWEDPYELEIFALLLKVRYPMLDTISGFYVWLRENRCGKNYELSDVLPYWQSVQLADAAQRQRPIDKEWEPTPNKLCGWCPVTTCEYCPVGTIRKGEYWEKKP